MAFVVDGCLAQVVLGLLQQLQGVLCVAAKLAVITLARSVDMRATLIDQLLRSFEIRILGRRRGKCGCDAAQCKTCRLGSEGKELHVFASEKSGTQLHPRTLANNDDRAEMAKVAVC
ncbi:hypothetical protein LMG27952_03634 [Paraburkholderia hiiakae]|uniref:Secreted protein n=1 Tax=Paraburkholderia hiiakae TaxID=1081782 RepID=A0ABN7HZK5_9BURK|nr:hypothetical protein LMG27952_03634 [Paraburkholderia hiiakae]